MASSTPKVHLTFSTTYRPPVPLELFSSSVTGGDEKQLLDGVSYNYNGHAIPWAALRNILTRSFFEKKNILANNVDQGSGLVFVSERTAGLETLHVAFRINGETKPRVFGLGEVYGEQVFGGVRMEDSGHVAGDDYLVYVSTKKPAQCRRQPWTAVYKTNLKNGCTSRLSPEGVADISPAISHSGKMIAVASFQRKDGPNGEKRSGWNGETEDLKTSIYVIDINNPCRRTLVTDNGGWPSWGSDSVLFFHRKVGNNWAVFKAVQSYNQQCNTLSWNASQVTPNGIDAITPAAIDTNSVAAAVVRKKFDFGTNPDNQRTTDQYRHVEVFSVTQSGKWVPITQKTKSLADHFNPFVIRDRHGGVRIGYHRCQDKLEKVGSSDKLHSPLKDTEVRRVSGSFPTFSKDGTKLAFVDNEFKVLSVVDNTGSLSRPYKGKRDSVFSPVWSNNPKDDTLFVCMGKSFKPKETVHIYAIKNVSTKPEFKQLTYDQSNNAFPTTNREGTKMVFRSTRDYIGKGHMNLYLMENIKEGDCKCKMLTRLTVGEWKDTHCDWSPNNDWIVFSSTQANPGVEHYAVYMLNINHKDTVIRVITSADNGFGFVNHPFFSPDGRTLVVTSDLAAVSVDPISLPFFLHSVRPYGDLFTVEIDPNKMENNRDLKHFRRVTHSRYENALATWANIRDPVPSPHAQVSSFIGTTRPNVAISLSESIGGLSTLGNALGSLPSAIKDPIDVMLSQIPVALKQGGVSCPFLKNGGQSVHLTGHLLVPSRGC